MVVTADENLREELLRLAAAAGVEPELAGDPAAALRGWTRAPVVLVGSDLADGLAELTPARRDGVHVVGWGPIPSELFRVAVVLGAEGVAELPVSGAWVVETLTDVGEARRVRGRVVGVLGGSGGAGATTLACALGQTAARTGDAVVLDCDPLGPGVDRVLGLEGEDGFRWDALDQTTGRLSARALRDALPRSGRLGALSWRPGSEASLQPFALREALSAAQRGHDTVVLDLPRSPDRLLEELLARCDLVLMVVVPSVAGVASAARTGARHVPAGPSGPPAFDAALDAGFGAVVRGTAFAERDVEQAVGVPVLATMRDQRGLPESIDLGLGPVRSPRGPLGRTCAALLGAVDRPEAATCA